MDTSVAAESRPLLYSNSAVTTETSSLAVEVTRRTSSIVLSSFSITRLTSPATSPAEAPGHTVTTAICGRSLSGKRFTGILKNPTSPTTASSSTTESNRCGFFTYEPTKFMTRLRPGR